MLARVDLSLSRRALGVGRAWRALGTDRRLACGAALGLFVTLFLPWYSQTVTAPGVSATMTMHVTVSGWQALSGVGVVLALVAVGVPTWLLVRAARWRGAARPYQLRAKRLDGVVLQLLGLLSVVLTAIAMIDHTGTTHHAPARTSSGIGWGLVFTLVCAIALMAVGVRTRAVVDAERRADVAGESGDAGRDAREAGAAGEPWTEAAPEREAQDGSDVATARAQRARERTRARRRRAAEDGATGHVWARTHPEPLGLDHRD